MVRADADRLAQIVANLVDNALKYARTSVTVSTSRSGAEAVLTVDDDGPGIATEDLPHVFERLYVSRHDPVRRETGSGLGLAIVHELVAAMSGTVVTETAPSGGARMVVRLPVPESLRTTEGEIWIVRSSNPTCSLSAPVSPACMPCTGSANSASRYRRSKRAPTSAARGTGIVTPARVATCRVSNIRTASRRSSSRSGIGRRCSPRRTTSCDTRITSPTNSICGATCNSTRASSKVEWQDDTRHWRLTSEAGETFEAPFCVMATGCLSVPVEPKIPGAERFRGEVYHTGRWPHEPVDLTGKRVGVIGTGSSGVQAIPELARQSAHLTVFQRTPVYTVPANRKRMREAVQQEFRDNYRQIREMQQKNAGGVSNFRPRKSVRRGDSVPADVTRPSDITLPSDAGVPNRLLDLTPEQREQAMERFGLGALLAFRDVYTNVEANEIANELYRDTVRTMVRDPDTAEHLLPKTYGLGCKRQVLDRDYYDTFNRDNVTLVDLMRDADRDDHRIGHSHQRRATTSSTC